LKLAVMPHEVFISNLHMEDKPRYKSCSHRHVHQLISGLLALMHPDTSDFGRSFQK